MPVFSPFFWPTCGDKDAKDQRDRQSVKDRVIQNEEGTQHGRQSGKHDRLGARDGRVDNGTLEWHTLVYLQIDEVHQQDGVANNDASERNHSDHAGCCVLRTEQGMSRHDSNNG